MDVSAITAICAIIIALASLAVSILEARATRKHDRQSVRPVLQIVRINSFGDSRTGLMLRNVGFGPAVIVDTAVSLDGRRVGRWDRDTFGVLIGSNRPIPRLSTLYNDAVVPAGDESFLIVINQFKRRRHAWFWELIAQRLSIEIRYESIYGGENFTVLKGPRTGLLKGARNRSLCAPPSSAANLTLSRKYSAIPNSRWAGLSVRASGRP